MSRTQATARQLAGTRTQVTDRLVIRNWPYSLNFNGTSAYVDFGNNYAFERTDSFSVCGTIMLAKYDASNSSILRKSSTAGFAQGWMIYVDSAGLLTVILASSASSANRILVSTTSANKIIPGRRYFFCATYDGTSLAAGFKFYLAMFGGVLTGPLAKTTTTDALVSSIVNTQKLRLGSASNGARFFNGWVQGVSIFNDDLSLSEIQNIYYRNIYPSSTASTWISTNTNGTGATLNDEVGSISGTITSATWSSVTAIKNRTQVT